MKKLGLSYDDLKEKFPKLIYCSISGYGHTGPYADFASHDANFLSYAGLLSITGIKQSRPILPGFQTADIAGGTLTALSSILAALYSRSNTGKGQHLDISMLDGTLGLMPLQISEYLSTKKQPEKEELMLSGGLPNYSIYKCKDGRYIMLAALEERFFRYFLEHVGKTHILDSIPPPLNEEKLAKLRLAIEEIFLSKNRDEWQEFFTNPDTCLSPVNDIKDALQDPPVTSQKNGTYRETSRVR